MLDILPRWCHGTWVTERDFAHRVTAELIARGRRVLRVCDRADARHGLFGLKVLGVPIRSAGADYLVLPREGMTALIVRDIGTVRDIAGGHYGFFLELKDPERRVSARQEHEAEQEKWMKFVRG